MNPYKLIEENVDSFGLIAESPISNRDGGDTFQREGMFAFAAWCLYRDGIISLYDYNLILIRYEIVCTKLKSGWSYKRHSDPSMWYSSPDRMSRDQATPNVIAWGATGSRRLKEFFKDHLKRGLLFTWNIRKNWVYPPSHPKYEKGMDYGLKVPDVTLFGFWAYYIRGFDMGWWLYPLLCLFDVDLLVNSALKVVASKNQKEADDLNHMVSLIYALKKYPTPFSWLAKMVYKRRGLASPHPEYPNESFGPQSALNYYFRGTGQNQGPRLNEVYKPILDRYLK